MDANHFSLRQLFLAITLAAVGFACTNYGDPYTVLGCVAKYLVAGAAFGAALGVLGGRLLLPAVAGVAVGLFVALLL
jgi:hypothetical protein